MSARKKDAYSGEVFSISFRGYNREDVNKYIARIDDERVEQVAALNADKRALEARALRAEKECASLAVQIEALKAENGDKLNALEMRFKEEIEAHKKKIDQLTEELSDAQTRVKRAEDDLKVRSLGDEEIVAIDNDELSELRRKAALYDKLESSLGSSFANATIAANTIVSAAEEDAAKTRALAEEELITVREAIRKSAGDAIEDICVLIGRETVERLEGMLRRIKRLESDAEELAEKLDGEVWQTKTNIAFVKASLEAEILKRLALITVDPERADGTSDDSGDKQPVIFGQKTNSSPKAKRAGVKGKKRVIRVPALRGLRTIFRSVRKNK